jgi:hypothetical protein
MGADEGRSEDDADIAPLYAFPVERVKDNRLNGLLREIADLIRDEDDPRVLRHFSTSLKLLADRARSRGYSLDPDHNRIW